MRLKYFSALALAASFASVSLTAHADTFVWATWTTDTPGASAAGGGIATATMPGFTITYTGQLSGLNGGPSWNPPSTWIGGVVGNGPPVDATSVHMEGGPNSGLETITFSGPVANPVLAIWSLGEPNQETSFDFNSSEPFTIAGGGPSAEYGGSGLVINIGGHRRHRQRGQWTDRTPRSLYLHHLHHAGLRELLQLHHRRRSDSHQHASDHPLNSSGTGDTLTLRPRPRSDSRRSKIYLSAAAPNLLSPHSSRWKVAKSVRSTD